MATFQYLDEGGSEAQDRLATSFLLAQTSAGLATTGVLSGLAVTQTTTASGSVRVAAGAAAVQASVGTGVALLVNDTLATLDVFTANPMGGLPRNDIVAFDSVTKTTAVILGAPNATPDDPTVPATACALYRLRHAAGATTIPTAKIDDLRVYTGLFAGAPAYTAYTATLGSSGTAPNLGSGGNQAGYYTVFGMHVSGQASIFWGTGPTVGTGFYVINLPTEVATHGAVGLRVGLATIIDVSTGAMVICDLVAVNASQAKLTYSAGPTTAAIDVSYQNPWTPAAGDTYRVRFDYERA